jgi:hypothetical protein
MISLAVEYLLHRVREVVEIITLQSRAAQRRAMAKAERQGAEEGGDIPSHPAKGRAQTQET